MTHPHAHPVTGASPTCVDCLGVIIGRGPQAIRCLDCLEKHQRRLAQKQVARFRARAAAVAKGEPVPDWAAKRKAWTRRKK